MEGARSILLSITGGPDLSLFEVSEAAKVGREAAHPDANIIFGANVDEKLDRPDLGDRRRHRLRRPRPPRRGARRRERRADGEPRAASRPAEPRRRRELRVAPARPRRARRPRVRPRPLAGPHGGQRGRRRRGPPADRRGRRAASCATGGNAVDAAVAAVLASFAAESPLTGLGAGGFMLVHAGGEATCCSTSSSRRRARRGRARRRAGRRSTVRFDGDAAQMFYVGAASCGVPGHGGRPRRGAAALRHDAARRAVGAGGRAGPRGRAGQRRAGLHPRDPRADPRPTTPEARELYAPGGALLREGELFRFPELAEALERSAPRAPSRSTAARSARAIGDRSSSAAARSAAPTSPPTRRSSASRSRAASAAARSSPTRRRPRAAS